MATAPGLGRVPLNFVLTDRVMDQCCDIIDAWQLTGGNVYTGPTTVFEDFKENLLYELQLALPAVASVWPQLPAMATVLRNFTVPNHRQMVMVSGATKSFLAILKHEYAIRNNGYGITYRLDDRGRETGEWFIMNTISQQRGALHMTWIHSRSRMINDAGSAASMIMPPNDVRLHFYVYSGLDAMTIIDREAASLDYHVPLIEGNDRVTLDGILGWDMESDAVAAHQVYSGVMHQGVMERGKMLWDLYESRP